MIETVLGMLVALLCVAGAVNIIKWAVLRLVTKGDESRRVYMVMLYGNDADIRLQMAIETMEWDCALSKVKAYAVDCGLDSAISEYCSLLCQDSRFKFVKLQDIDKELIEYSKKINTTAEN